MKLQPHESHIPFTQQFMIDFNLFGMSMVNFSKVLYRQNPEKPGKPCRLFFTGHLVIVNLELLAGVDASIILPLGVKKTSHCALEVDVLAEDILNRLEQRGAAGNPGLAGIWAEERARRLLKGLSLEPTPPSTQSRPIIDPFGVEFDFLKDLKQRISKFTIQVSLFLKTISFKRLKFA